MREFSPSLTNFFTYFDDNFKGRLKPLTRVLVVYG